MNMSLKPILKIRSLHCVSGGGGSNYGTLDPMDLPPGHAPPPHPADMAAAQQQAYDQQVPPQPPRDNNQMAAWYDTDL